MKPGLVLKLVVVIAVVVAVVCLFALTPVREISSVEDLQRLVAPVVSSPWLPVIILAAFLVAGLIMLSVWLVVLQTALLFPPLVAFPLALGGAVLSATTFYALGRVLGRDVVVKFAPQKVQDSLGSVTLSSIIAVRLLPVLPFTLVNMCCGASNVPLRTFVVGTVVGMAPGVLGLCLLGTQLVEVIKHPEPEAIAGLVVVVVALVAGFVVMRRRAARHTVG